ncbi:MAG: dTDP-4-dehydrorhamnose 3,5-epimerase [Lentimonas sp.]
MFDLLEEPLPGLKVIQPRLFNDERGAFVKTYHKALWRHLGIEFGLEEEFFSTSRKGVLRGMHFQAPPQGLSKIVYCVVGRVLDVVVDLRSEFSTYGAVASVELSAENRKIVYIPEGFAHGFLAVDDHSCLIYKTNVAYSPDHDLGVHWKSIDFDWPLLTPIVSERDQGFPCLGGFDSPF